MFLGNPSAQSYITCPHCTDPTSQLQSCACIIGMAFSLATVTGSDTSIWPKCTESKSNLEPLWEREAFHWKQSRTETRCCCHRPQIESTLCSCCLVTKLCPTIYDPMDWSPPGSSVHRIFQARILEWVAISYSRGSFQTKDQTHISCVSAGGFFILLSHQGRTNVTPYLIHLFHLSLSVLYCFCCKLITKGMLP